nr:hypothetical protein [Tanacetum cinerariifolium]
MSRYMLVNTIAAYFGETIAKIWISVRAWKNFDTKYPDFAKELRNARLGLDADGLNPFGNLSQAYSMWPVILMAYNLPPWLCMKKSSFMLKGVTTNVLKMYNLKLIKSSMGAWMGCSPEPLCLERHERTADTKKESMSGRAEYRERTGPMTAGTEKKNMTGHTEQRHGRIADTKKVCPDVQSITEGREL